MFQKILSYFIPINIYKSFSEVSQTLEVTMVNGALVLDSKNTNYSFGSLQRILKYGLDHIGLSKVKNSENILILGVAAGSVIHTLRDDFDNQAPITGIELDANVLEIARKHFNLDTCSNLNLIIGDAFEFVLKTKEKYDLIIIDVFQDIKMPNFLFESFFVNRLGEIVSKGGMILFNTMILNETDNTRNLKYITDINPSLFAVSVLPRVEKHNEIIVLERK